MSKQRHRSHFDRLESFVNLFLGCDFLHRTPAPGPPAHTCPPHRPACRTALNTPTPHQAWTTDPAPEAFWQPTRTGYAAGGRTVPRRTTVQSGAHLFRSRLQQNAAAHHHETSARSRVKQAAAGAQGILHTPCLKEVFTKDRLPRHKIFLYACRISAACVIPIKA